MSRRTKRLNQKSDSNVKNWLKLFTELNKTCRNFTKEESQEVEDLERKTYTRRKIDF